VKSSNTDATKQAMDINDTDCAFAATECTAIIEDLACRANCQDWFLKG
jgi:hypothetical protein